jgi:hypothetical protein
MDKDFFGDDIFTDDSTLPESNWFTFKEVGDNIIGKLVMEPFDKEGNFGKQRVYVLQTKDGKEFNIGLKYGSNEMNIRQLKSAEIGDIIAIKFKGEVDTGKGNPAKSLEVRIRHIKKAE